MDRVCRLDRIKPFHVMDILEKAQRMDRQGADVVHLEIGEPDFDTPDCVKEAAMRAIREGQTHYTHSLGIPELREAICEHYQDRYGCQVHPDQVIVTSGTSPAMLLAFATLCSRGEAVVIPDPGYACYANFMEFAGGRPVPVRVSAEAGFQYRTPEVAAALDRNVSAILVNSPGNPSGTLLDPSVMRELAGLGPWIVSDEIYHGLTYEGEEHSVLEYTDKAFVLNGFSKLYAMTGWRLGYLIAPREFMGTLQRLAQNLFICAGSVAQWAGLAALRHAGDDVRRMREVYDRRRRHMISRLRELGFGVRVEPTAAFYVLADARAFSDDSLAFAAEILEQARVAVTPGMDFGCGGEGHIRFSYANSLENIEKGMDRLQRFLAMRTENPSR